MKLAPPKKLSHQNLPGRKESFYYNKMKKTEEAE